MSTTNENEETITTITATTHLTLPKNPKPLTYAQLNPVSKASEFLGPWGTLFVSTFTPFFAYFLFFACNEHTGCHPRSSSAWNETLSGMLGEWTTSKGKLWDWDAVLLYLGWYGFCVLCWAILPGEKVQGTLMRDGKRKTYTMNGESSRPYPVAIQKRVELTIGFYTLVLALGITLGYLLHPGGVEKFTWVYDHWVPLMSASLAMSVIQATWVWAWSFASGELLALGGNSGNIVYDVGPSTHPRLSPSTDNSGSWVDLLTPPSPGSQTLTSRRSTRFDRVSLVGTYSTLPVLANSISGWDESRIVWFLFSSLRAGTLSTRSGKRSVDFLLIR